MTITAQVLTGTIQNSPLDWIVVISVAVCFVAMSISFLFMVINS